MCNITCTFPSSFRLRRQEIDLEFSEYLELRGDKFRDLKNESTMKIEKQNCNLFHPSKLAHSVKNKFKIFARGSHGDAKKNIFKPIGVTEVCHELGLHLEPAR